MHHQSLPAPRRLRGLRTPPTSQKRPQQAAVNLPDLLCPPPQRSSSSCCGGCTCATPSAPCPLLSTSRATWPRPSTTSCWSRPSSTSSGKRSRRNTCKLAPTCKRLNVGVCVGGVYTLTETNNQMLSCYADELDSTAQLQSIFLFSLFWQ